MTWHFSFTPDLVDETANVGDLSGTGASPGYCAEDGRYPGHQATPLDSSSQSLEVEVAVREQVDQELLTLARQYALEDFPQLEACGLIFSLWFSWLSAMAIKFGRAEADSR